MKRRRQLPELTESQFRRQLAETATRYLDEAAVPTEPLSSLGSTLYRHYSELCRWNPLISLIGPGTTSEVVRRHYGESLAALAFLEKSDRRVLDVGSGAGFPGLVLAAASPRLEVTLVEARERKWLFLKAAVRRCELSCHSLNARVEPSKPADFLDGFDLVTSRALATNLSFFESVHARSPQARFLLWQGKEEPDVESGFEICREAQLAGSQRRRILEIRARG